MSSKILFVGHDANRAGAQLVLLNWLKEQFSLGKKSYLILEKGGPLVTQYRKYATVWIWQTEQSGTKKIVNKLPFFKREESFSVEPSKQERVKLIQLLRKEKFDLIIGNTVASLGLMQRLQVLRAPFSCYVHELAFSLAMYASEADMLFLKQKVAHVLVVSDQVKKVLIDKFQLSEEVFFVFPPLVEGLKAFKPSQAHILKESLGIPFTSKVVLGCGQAEWRKGTDIFVRVARKVLKTQEDVHFVWLGIGDNVFSEELKLECSIFDTEGKMHLIPVKADARPYFEMANLFFLSSREDPFPLVMLEAAALGKSIVGFRGTGGIEDFSAGLTNVLVNYMEESEAAELIINQLNEDSDDLRNQAQELKNRALNYNSKAFIERWRLIEQKIIV